MTQAPARRPTPHYIVRGLRVTFDFDLAAAYGVTTSHLNRIVRRNRDRFPGDFVFELTDHEIAMLRCQDIIAAPHLRSCRYRPFAFTTPGVLMLLTLLPTRIATSTLLTYLRNSA